MPQREIKGWHVATMFGGAFAVIIAVNVLMATKAIATFPGLEVRNSYVASQTFDADRAAQEALGWSVEATIEAGTLRLSFADATGPVEPVIAQATLGRATSVRDDRVPGFTFDGTAFVAPVANLAPGKWDLRLEARAADGTIFRRRFELKVR